MRIETWTWPELVSTAGGRSQAQRLLRDKQVWRVLHGVYVGAEHPDVADVRLAAVQRVVPEHAVLAGRTALWALGVPLGDCPTPVEVVVPRGLHLRPKQGVRVRAMALPEAELVPRGTRLLTSAARAAVDIARRDGLVEGVAHADAALRAGLTTAVEIAACLERAAGLRGVVQAREIVPHLEPRSESLMESRLRMRLVHGGVARPEAQVDFYDQFGGHCARADLFLDGVVFEHDGFDAHAAKGAFVKDRRRANALSNGGLVVCRFTGDDYYARPPGFIVGTARAALAEAARRQGGVRLLRGPDTLRAPTLSVPLTVQDLAGRSAA